jgi:hypothetical protein
VYKKDFIEIIDRALPRCAGRHYYLFESLSKWY